VWDRIWSEYLDERKGEVLVRIWKEKEKAKKAKEEKNMEKSRIRERNRNGEGEKAMKRREREEGLNLEQGSVDGCMRKQIL